MFYLLQLLALIMCSKAAPVSDLISSTLNILEDDYMYAQINEEFGDKFEGDMILSNAQKRVLNNLDDASRNGLRGATKRWPDKLVIYYITEDEFDEKQIKIIEDGMSDIANRSCVRFRPRNDEKEHSVIIKGSGNGCFSNVGFSTEDDDEGEVSQVLNLSKGCFRHGTVVHEMLHTIGFYHMQSTYDRDEFVKINWENILPGTEHNFAKYNNDTVTDFGVTYDYSSVMHYPETAFSKNGNKTIEPLQLKRIHFITIACNVNIVSPEINEKYKEQPNLTKQLPAVSLPGHLPLGQPRYVALSETRKDNVKIGQRNGLSDSDILKLNKMYCEENEQIS